MFNFTSIQLHCFFFPQLPLELFIDVYTEDPYLSLNYYYLC